MILSDRTSRWPCFKKILAVVFVLAFGLTVNTQWSYAGAPNPQVCTVVAIPPCSLCSVGVLIEETAEWTWPVPGITSTTGTYPRLRRHVITENTAMRVWTVAVFWEDNILPALMLMAEQLSAVAMKQAEIIGAFLDAKHQLETQQVFQKLAARAHKDYYPSTGVCEFGSGSKSLAASERKAELNEVVLAQHSQDRNTGNANTAASIGDDSDKESRIKQFREKFCDPRDNNDGLKYMCEHDQDQNMGNSTIGNNAPGGIGAPNNYTPPFPPAAPAAPSPRKNKDIDYTRTVDFPWTLNVDFTNSTLTDNEEEVMALAANLYGTDIFVRPPSKALQTVPGPKINTMQSLYLDARSVMAKKSVAENSFNAITAMKSEGTPGSHDYLVALMAELGVPAADIDTMLGGPNPSYYAQMEVLTKKLFQNPDFYTNLYDTPANVSRKGVAIQAIGLMQKFDLYKSYLRNEASLSVLLELAVGDLQDEVENQLNEITGQGGSAAPP